MTRDQLVAWIEDRIGPGASDGVMLMDGYDDCFVGLVDRFGLGFPIACYDKRLVLAKLQAQGMSADEAVEWFDFNQIGAWMGEGTPCFIMGVTFT